MDEKYTPYIFAVAHHAEIAEQVAQLILDLGIKSVGVEYEDSGMLNDEFFKRVINALKRHDIKIVFLLNRRLVGRIIRELEKARNKWGGIITSKHPAREGIQDYGQALLKDTMTRSMEEKARKEKPELLLVGIGHGFIMRQDLKVPKHKF